MLSEFVYAIVETTLLCMFVCNAVVGFFMRFEDDSVESAKIVKQWNVKIISVSILSWFAALILVSYVSLGLAFVIRIIVTASSTSFFSLFVLFSFHVNIYSKSAD